MSTPINQLPPGQPVANDPALVQQILRETQVQHQSPRPDPQDYYQQPRPILQHHAIQQRQPNYLTRFNYMEMVKHIILVATLVFLSQIPSVKEMVSTYIPDNFNLIVRSLIAGVSFIGLEQVFT